MLGARLIQDWIRIVQMNKHFALDVEIFKQPQAFFDRNVSHLMRGLAAPLNAYQLIVAPKGAIE
jgi:hypothetical protein